MNNFKQRMNNIHPCLVEKFETMEEEINSLNKTWRGTNLLLGISNLDELVDVTNSENVDINSFNMLSNCDDIFLKVLIESNRYYDGLYHHLFKVKAGVGGMGEKTIEFTTIPYMAGDGTFYMLKLMLWSNYTNTQRKIGLYVTDNG